MIKIVKIKFVTAQPGLALYNEKFLDNVGESLELALARRTITIIRTIRKHPVP